MLKYFAAPIILFMMSCGGTQDHSGHAGHVSAQAEAPKALPGDPTSQLLGTYYHLKSTLVEADSVAADSAAIAFAGLATKTDVKSLQADTTLLEQLRTMLDSMAMISSDIPRSPDLTARRRAFSLLGEHMLSFLNQTGYSASTVYVQECPMAFNDTETAYWLSDASEIINPYLGKKHPKYSAGMLHCGELKDSIPSKP
jgi:hypothetical protein